MSNTEKPEFREEESWYSEEQLDKLTPADGVDDDLRSPIPLQMVANGEYMPIPQTPQQKEVEIRLRALSEHASKQLNISRRKFLATSGGMAAAFIAMNEVFGRFFNVRPSEMFMPEAYAATGVPADLFVFDDQLHIIRSSRTGPGNSLRDIAQGNHSSNNPSDLPDELGRVNYPWNPALVGLPNLNSNFQLIQFMKDVYLDSQVTIGMMTNNNSAAIPDISGPSRPPRNVAESEANEILTAEQTMKTRDWVNAVAGSQRMMGHGQLYVGVGNLDYIQYQMEFLKPDSWKGYTIATAAKVDTDPNSDMRRWRLDDEAVAYPTYQLIVNNRAALKTKPGFRNICIHKGLATTNPPQPELGHPGDIPKAATDWPMLNFIIYHSAIRPSFWALNALTDLNSGRLRAGVPDIQWVTEFAVTSAPFRNVYAELGTTFASTVITFPTVCAHILGQLLKFFGEDRVVFGSDSVWYGSPQWQIEALWRFEIPEAMRLQYGYPEMTETVKRKIFGLNSARLYRVGADGNVSPGGLYKPVPTNYESLVTDELKRVLEFPGFTGTGEPVAKSEFVKMQEMYAADDLSKMKEIYKLAGGEPSNTRHGWLRTRA